MSESTTVDVAFAQKREAVIQALPQEMSPYQLAKFVSQIHGRTIKPQMMYNYVKNNMLKVTTNSLGHKIVSRNDAVGFIAKYQPKN